MRGTSSKVINMYMPTYELLCVITLIDYYIVIAEKMPKTVHVIKNSGLILLTSTATERPEDLSSAVLMSCV